MSHESWKVWAFSGGLRGIDLGVRGADEPAKLCFAACEAMVDAQAAMGDPAQCSRILEHGSERPHRVEVGVVAFQPMPRPEAPEALGQFDASNPQPRVLDACCLSVSTMLRHSLKPPSEPPGSADEGMRLASEQQRRYKSLKVGDRVKGKGNGYE